MIFDEIVTEVCDQLNLTSDEAKSRIGRRINSRYRRITSSIGLEVSRRVPVSQAVTPGNRYVTFNGVEKILAVIDKSSGKDITLDQVTIDEMHDLPVKADPPRHFAVTTMTANSVTVWLDASPAKAYTLYADGEVTVTTLSGSQAPAFPESFHDILVFGVVADEYRKMEKPSLARDAETDYEKRLSDLRMWIAKSAYLDNYQSKNKWKRWRLVGWNNE